MQISCKNEACHAIARALLCQRKTRDCSKSILKHANKQLLDEVEHDIMNYQKRGLCYRPKPKAEADNTDTRF